MNIFKKTSGTVLLSAAMLVFVASCDKKKTPTPDDKPEGNKPAITLDCDYFKTDRILKDDPEAPVDYIITCRVDA